MRELTQIEIINVSGAITPELMLLMSISSFGFTLGMSALTNATLETAAYIMTASFGFNALLLCC